MRNHPAHKCTCIDQSCTGCSETEMDRLRKRVAELDAELESMNQACLRRTKTVNDLSQKLHEALYWLNQIGYPGPYDKSANELGKMARHALFKIGAINDQT